MSLLKLKLKIEENENVNPKEKEGGLPLALFSAAAGAPELRHPRRG